jgi:20S proteasome alpha/beta subunit
VKLPKKVKKSRFFFTMIPEPLGNHVMILGPDENQGNPSLMYFSLLGNILSVMLGRKVQPYVMFQLGVALRLQWTPRN